MRGDSDNFDCVHQFYEATFLSDNRNYACDIDQSNVSQVSRLRLFTPNSPILG